MVSDLPIRSNALLTFLKAPSPRARAPCAAVRACGEIDDRTCRKASKCLSYAPLIDTYLAQMRRNGWRAELTLTARLKFLTRSRGEIFDRALPLRISFPRATFPPRAVEARLDEFEVVEHV